VVDIVASLGGGRVPSAARAARRRRGVGSFDDDALWLDGGHWHASPSPGHDLKRIG
jgi:hypothetical protein